MDEIWWNGWLGADDLSLSDTLEPWGFREHYGEQRGFTYVYGDLRLISYSSLAMGTSYLTETWESGTNLARRLRWELSEQLHDPYPTWSVPMGRIY